jgi:hypothetical protein
MYTVNYPELIEPLVSNDHYPMIVCFRPVIEDIPEAGHHNKGYAESDDENDLV